MKRYKLKSRDPRLKTIVNLPKPSGVYHIDAYRVGAKDILDLGWKEIINGKNNIVIVEWVERIKEIIPESDVVWNLNV